MKPHQKSPQPASATADAVAAAPVAEGRSSHEPEPAGPLCGTYCKLILGAAATGAAVVGGELAKDGIIVGTAATGANLGLTVAGAVGGGAVTGKIVVDGVADHATSPGAPAEPAQPVPPEPASSTDSTELEKRGAVLEDAGKLGKAGAAGGERARKPFTRAIKRDAKAENAAAHDGQTTCMNCKKPTVPSQQSRRGVTPPGNEANVDHIISIAKDGDGTLENAQVLCRDCNLKKGSK